MLDVRTDEAKKYIKSFCLENISSACKRRLRWR